jgi:hypothetical protein
MRLLKTSTRTGRPSCGRRNMNKPIIQYKPSADCASHVKEPKKCMEEELVNILKRWEEK